MKKMRIHRLVLESPINVRLPPYREKKSVKVTPPPPLPLKEDGERVTSARSLQARHSTWARRIILPYNTRTRIQCVVMSTTFDARCSCCSRLPCPASRINRWGSREAVVRAFAIPHKGNPNVYLSLSRGIEQGNLPFQPPEPMAPDPALAHQMIHRLVITPYDIPP